MRLVLFITNVIGWYIYYIFFAEDKTAADLIFWAPFMGLMTYGMVLALWFQLWWGWNKAEIFSDILSHHTDGKWR